MRKDITIQEAMSHRYFGSTPAKCEEFFTTLKAEFQETIIIASDNPNEEEQSLQSFPEFNDFSRLIPGWIESIRSYNKVLADAKADISTKQQSIVLLQETAKSFLDTPKKLRYQQKTTTPIIKKIYRNIGLFDPEGKIGEACLQKLTYQDLLNSLDAAVIKYTSQQHSCWSSLFHGEKAK